METPTRATMYKTDEQQGPTGNSTQHFVMTCKGKESEKRLIYNWIALLYSWNHHNTVGQLHLNKKQICNNK